LYALLQTNYGSFILYNAAS